MCPCAVERADHTQQSLADTHTGGKGETWLGRHSPLQVVAQGMYQKVSNLSVTIFLKKGKRKEERAVDDENHGISLFSHVSCFFLFGSFVTKIRKPKKR